MSVSVRTVTELYMLRFSFNVSRISNSFDRLSSFQTKGKKVLQHYEEIPSCKYLSTKRSVLTLCFFCRNDHSGRPFTCSRTGGTSYLEGAECLAQGHVDT